MTMLPALHTLTASVFPPLLRSRLRQIRRPERTDHARYIAATGLLWDQTYLPPTGALQDPPLPPIPVNSRPALLRLGSCSATETPREP